MQLFTQSSFLIKFRASHGTNLMHRDHFLTLEIQRIAAKLTREGRPWGRSAFDVWTACCVFCFVFCLCPGGGFRGDYDCEAGQRRKSAGRLSINLA
jgi:hypothetical protein